MRVMFLAVVLSTLSASAAPITTSSRGLQFQVKSLVGKEDKTISVFEETRQNKKVYTVQYSRGGKVIKTKLINVAQFSAAESLTLNQIWDNNYRTSKVAMNKKCKSAFEIDLKSQKEFSKVCSEDYPHVASTEKFVATLSKIVN